MLEVTQYFGYELKPPKGDTGSMYHLVDPVPLEVFLAKPEGAEKVPVTPLSVSGVEGYRESLFALEVAGGWFEDR